VLVHVVHSLDSVPETVELEASLMHSNACALAAASWDASVEISLADSSAN
jgi:hypothetical protein